jgi:anti-sigma factor RsiW
MKQSEIFRENAENCAHLAESAANEPAFHRFKRMEAAWRALADEQDWLDGEVSPARIPPARKGKGSAGAKSGTSDAGS